MFVFHRFDIEFDFWMHHTMNLKGTRNDIWNVTSMMMMMMIILSCWQSINKLIDWYDSIDWFWIYALYGWMNKSKTKFEWQHACNKWKLWFFSLLMVNLLPLIFSQLINWCNFFSGPQNFYEVNIFILNLKQRGRHQFFLLIS